MEAKIYNKVTRISCLDLFITLLLALWHKIVQKVVTNDSFQVFLGLVVKCLVVDLGSKGIEMYSLIAAIECTNSLTPLNKTQGTYCLGGFNCCVRRMSKTKCPIPSLPLAQTVISSKDGWLIWLSAMHWEKGF